MRPENILIFQKGYICVNIVFIFLSSMTQMLSAILPGNFPKPFQFIANNRQMGSMIILFIEKKSGTSQLEELERVKREQL